MDLLHLLLIESALELVPDDIRGHPAVRNQAQRSGKKPVHDILDGTFHHSAMRRLPDGDKRGRPDIIHLTLLVAQGSILNRQGLLRTYIHTCKDELIEISPTTRLPRNIERFKGVMAQLLSKGEIKARSDEGTDGEEALLKLTRNMDVKRILEKIAPDKVFVLEDGKDIDTFEGVLREEGFTPDQLRSSQVAVLVGGFPHGDFKTDIDSLADRTFSIYDDKLELWTVIANVLMDAERMLRLYSSDR